MKRRGLAEEPTREPGSDDGRCVHCRGVVPSGTVCPSCVVLLELHGREDVPMLPPTPAPVPAPAPAPEHNGYWLYHDARQQGDLQAVIDFGHAPRIPPHDERLEPRHGGRGRRGTEGHNPRSSLMPYITVCGYCGGLMEASSEEQANDPDPRSRRCPLCARTPPDHPRKVPPPPSVDEEQARGAQ